MSNILGPITMEAGPAVEAETGPWYKLSEADMQAFAEYTGALDKAGNVNFRLNIFFEDGRSRYAIFSKQEWEYLNATLGRERVISNHGKIFTIKEIGDIKNAMNRIGAQLTVLE